MYCSPAWQLSLKQDSKILEPVQHRYTKRLSGVHDLTYRDRLRSLGALSMENKIFHAYMAYSIQKPSP